MMIGSLIFIASVVIPSGDSNKTAEKSDKELLQGAWIPVAVATDGKVMTMEQYRREECDQELKRVVFSGDTCSVELRKDEETTIVEAQLRLHTSQRPKQIDFVLEHETSEGIYSVTTDDLRICTGDGVRRPPAFKTKGEPNFQLWMFKREKPQGSSSEASHAHHGK